MNNGFDAISSAGPDLGARATVALLTPAENPTAEPELSVLLPPDINMLTARMYAPAKDMHARLRAYELGLAQWLAPFGDAPLDAIAFACTGSTYLLDHAQRFATIIERASGPCPVIKAACAVEDALNQLAAKRIALVSPYPESLTGPATDYWRAAGFLPDLVVQAPPSQRLGHPIYTQSSATLLAALRQAVANGQVDAIVATGTGAPSLPALAVASLETDVPVLSSNLATAWSVCCQLGGQETVRDWLAPDATWRARLAARFPTALARLQQA